MHNSSKSFSPPVALTIAGSDSGGGAGIQADLRVFSFHQIHGASALTCVTAQNTMGVTRVDALPAESVLAQIEAVTTDMSVAAVKTGMLFNREIIDAVARHLRLYPIANLVVDPVMVSRAGDKLLDDDGIESMRNLMLPLAKVLTPNRHEAQLLAGIEIKSLEGMQEAARIIHSSGPNVVMLKGGAMARDLCGVDVWFDGRDVEVLTTQFVDTPNTHGTGCTLSAAIAANLALGREPIESCVAAKNYVTEALRHSLTIGKGKGPVGHGYQLRGLNQPL